MAPPPSSPNTSSENTTPLNELSQRLSINATATTDRHLLDTIQRFRNVSSPSTNTNNGDDTNQGSNSIRGEITPETPQPLLTHPSELTTVSLPPPTFGLYRDRPNLNNLNLLSGYMIRNLPEGNRQEAEFRSRMLRHFSDLNRIHTHFNELIGDRTIQEGGRGSLSGNRGSFTTSSIPAQLHNLSRELTRLEQEERQGTTTDPIGVSPGSGLLNRNRNRDAYVVETDVDLGISDNGEDENDDDQSFEYSADEFHEEEQEGEEEEEEDQDDEDDNDDEDEDMEIIYYPDLVGDDEDDIIVDDDEDDVDDDEESTSSSFIVEEENIGLRSDIRSNERLLLSSARQNPLNENTLIPTNTAVRNRYGQPPPRTESSDSSNRQLLWYPPTLGGTPLRRQNAIRLRHRNRRYNLNQDGSIVDLGAEPNAGASAPISTSAGSSGANREKKSTSAGASTGNGEGNDDTSGPSTKSKINQQEILIQRAKKYQREVENIIQELNQRGYIYYHAPLFCNFLNQSSSQPSLLFRNVLAAGKDNLSLSMDEYLIKRRNKLLWLSQSNGIEPPPPAPHPSQQRGIKKRKGRPPKSRSPHTKRQKLDIPPPQPDQEIIREQIFNMSMNTNGDTSPPAELTKSEKENILDSLPCSYFQSGVSYTMKIDSPTDHALDYVNLIMNNISPDRRNIDGILNFTGNGSENGGLEFMLFKLHNFTRFFFGFMNNGLIKNKILIRKLNVLDRLSIDQNVKYSKKLRYDNVNIPISGHVIDFKNEDLRFMKFKEPNGTVSSISRFKSMKVKQQLLLWMRLQPFVQFRRMYLMNFMNDLNENLKSLIKLKKGVCKRQLSKYISLTKEFRMSFQELIKVFPMSKKKLKKISPKTTTGTNGKKSNSQKKYRTLFLEDWDRGSSYNLNEIITSDDSIALLNVQLNYVLFVVKINISQFLDIYFQFIFAHVENEDYLNRYKRVYENIQRDEKSQYSLKQDENTDELVLIGSINRKNGNIEMLNTFPFKAIKDRHGNYNPHVILTRHDPISINDFSNRNIYVYDDFELFNQEGSGESEVNIPLNSSVFLRSSRQEDEDDLISAKLTGHIKRDIGNPVCDMV
ncbi:uncharacterized protein J8A68_004231 [[Candida] subhashii]|uniref:Uncharacterized protein n=1 Tax=[Candida] subhashii TaxID=561895 RepID=A0A8J5UKQ8_9ASCO|nr:uncharacterized protein J8A68_004231 [[Candida] subhashii]KAG7662221.1 hypothetical protein J8A68_004231 [[Candida] subhashii]